MINPLTIPLSELEKQCREYNNAYRAGSPLITDSDYDSLWLKALAMRDPTNPFLAQVEPEQIGKDTVKHVTPLLSTDKAYSQDEINAYVDRVIREAGQLSVKEEALVFRITPKLDGIAASMRGGVLATRGDGNLGNNISNNIDRGLHFLFGKEDSVGEIVVVNEYFDSVLANEFDHPRNFVAGAIGADKSSLFAENAFNSRAIHFVDFSKLDGINVTAAELRADAVSLYTTVCEKVPYRLDGAVIEVVNDNVRDFMGSTSHHHRYMIALKQAGETATATVEGLTYQVGRTGKLTPVINIEPTYLTGATISNITGNHAGYVVSHGISKGSTIELTRAGSVIPAHVRTLESNSPVEIPSECPCCQSSVRMEGDFLYCNNVTCSERVVSRICHFFTILAAADYFGRATVTKLVANGVDDIPTIYALTVDQFRDIGFGEKQSVNLYNELHLRSRKEAIADYKFLAAFGIPDLGRGDSRKLLEAHSIETLNTIDASDIEKIKGFGKKTSQSIAASMPIIWPTIQAMLNLGFNLESRAPANDNSPLSGKNVVFTGSMSSSRDEMKSNARSFGANVQSKPTAKTDFLVIGQSVGKAKIDAAEKHGTSVITEAMYLEMIAA